MNSKKLILYTVLFLASFVSFAQNSEKKEKSAARRFADSLYYVHSIKPQQKQQQKQEENAKIDLSKTKDAKTNVKSAYTSKSAKIPSSTLYESTWYNERVKVPTFSFRDVPDEIVLRLIDPDKGQNFCFPIKKIKSSSYGWRWGRPHSGIDIALNVGDPIHAAFDGVVRLAKYNGGYGNCIVIRHYNNLETLYGHLSKINVKVGQEVKAGDVIGLGGNTGRSTGPHLHFECRLMYACFDPEWIFDLETYSIKTSFLRIDKTYFGVESSQQKANKKTQKSKLSKVDKCFENKPYISPNTLIAKERKKIKAGEIPQYSVQTQKNNSSTKAGQQFIVGNKGEKLKDIAKRFNIPLESLKKMNPNIKTTTLKEKTKIRIK
ncbi:MAG: M23 family metallopeptidase [Bacteroidales bacterium]|nr:M23 family metallopeptidase [Bacteroidales bacterium]MBQ5891406.1 M23 family metallopeptidase [Bacteroidales bacterium]